ncbi:hypothetical protein SISSUDRAFT_1118632 [Sistotremastrum suecicum HHB10207 ss-3]|uniref:Fungal-type protein kinase domain-containing protein n=1 Tax=Sistotremastrum suecicum HHB10207 ss-3 TaxID=1314776 RepID=A0A166ETD4_9AGAM|nr:hypothetical protein SISSUDRAFT_1118632 [Sistotremastrum suecicum HHB10207 ss-3]
MHGDDMDETDDSSRASPPSQVSFQTHVALSDRFVPFLCCRNATNDVLRIERILLDHYDPVRQKWVGWAWAKDQKSFKLSEALQTLNSFCAETDHLPLEDVHMELPPSDETVSESRRFFFNPVILCDQLLSPVLTDSLEPLAARAQHYLSHWMCLKYVYGILLSASCMVFVRFDRAGVVLSGEVDIHRDPNTILRAVFGCLALAKDSVDTSVSFPQDHSLLITSEAAQPARYVLEETLYHNPAIPGSGSRVFLVRDESEPETQLVLKDWWRDSKSIHEGEVLCTVSGLFGLPDYHSHWTVCNPDGNDQTTHFISDTLPLHPGFSRAQDNQEYDSEFEQQTEGAATIDLDRQLLIHTRLISKVKGEHLLKFRDSPRIVLTAIHDAILGHWSLFQAGYLHDDVSYGNILVLPAPVSASQFLNHSKLPVSPIHDQCTAILNDFDAVIPLAEFEKGNQLKRPKTKRGTILYMSTLLSEGFERFGSWAHDDLESFMWVLIVTAFSVKPPSSGFARSSVEHTMKICLFPEDPEEHSQVGDHKLGLMVALSGESGRPFSYTDSLSRQYHEPIRKWCVYMLDRYFPRLNRMEESIVGDGQIYLDVLSILRESIASLE